MATYTFFTNPMSRGQIARWALHEAGADYEQVLVDWQNKPDSLLEANPMAKVPVIIHHAAGGDQVVSESAAICAYLAEMHPDSGLRPDQSELAAYLRWFFFAAGPVEQATTARSMGFEPNAEQQGMAGWGSLERTVAMLDRHFAQNEYVCGKRFTMADVYVGSQVDWGLNFGTIPPEESLVAYAERFQAREAYGAAKAIDNKLIEEAKK